MKMRNVDVYVTGSNAKFLSKDIITEFRGRGFEVKMYPLNFKEYMSAYSGTVQAGFNEYMLYGGLPQILSYETEEQKVRFLKSLFDETYIKDIKDRYDIRKDDDLEELINIMASGIGALTNPNKLANTFRSEKKSVISYDTVKDYIDYLCDSFLIENPPVTTSKESGMSILPINIISWIWDCATHVSISASRKKSSDGEYDLQ